MEPRTRTRLGLYALILVGPIVWFASEIRWTLVNRPHGKFADVTGYLACGRGPNRVLKTEKDGKVFFIAYSPMDCWLALPSGPAAYVFGPDGRLVDWSGDTGDDPGFAVRWAHARRITATIEEMTKGDSNTASQGTALGRRP